MCAAVALALAVRLGLLWAAHAEPVRLYHEPDSSGYERLAVNLVRYHRFSLAERSPFPPDHTRTPGYPALLALVYAVTGPAPLVAGLVGALLGAATVAVLATAGARLVGHRAALLAAGLLAVDPTSAGYSVMLVTEAAFTLLLTLGLLRLAGALRAGALRSAGSAGLWLGLAALTRPIGVYLPLVLSAAVALRRQSRWSSPPSASEGSA